LDATTVLAKHAERKKIARFESPCPGVLALCVGGSILLVISAFALCASAERCSFRQARVTSAHPHSYGDVRTTQLASQTPTQFPVIVEEDEHVLSSRDCYADTAHRSQGKSVDVVVISTDVMRKELFYGAASRGQEHVTLVTSDKELLREAARSDIRQSATDLAHDKHVIRIACFRGLGKLMLLFPTFVRRSCEERYLQEYTAFARSLQSDQNIELCAYRRIGGHGHTDNGSRSRITAGALHIAVRSSINNDPVADGA
jgi:hypothetical protein